MQRHLLNKVAVFADKNNIIYELPDITGGNPQDE